MDSNLHPQVTVNPLEDRLVGSVSYYLHDEREEGGQVIIVISGADSLRSEMSPAEIKLSGGA